MKHADKVRLSLSALLTGLFIITGCQQASPVKPTPQIRAHAEIADERGIGGSGRQSEDTGIGGSGRVAESGIGGSGRQSDDRGIGGSGMLAQESGIGGSGRQQSEQTNHWLAQLQAGEKIGVVGTINDFGSVWVNGLHIHFNSRTPVTVDGQPVDPTTITLGQRAVITATMDADGKLWAEKIELIHEVIGPVSVVSPKQQSFTVLGQNVRLSPELVAVRPLPGAGEWVAVSGIRDQNQQIIASQISPVTDTSNILIRGPLSATAERLAISQQTLNVIPDEAHQQGHFALIRGQLIDNQLQQITIERQRPLTETSSVRLMSIERTAKTMSHAGPYSPSPRHLPSTPISGQGVQVIEGHIAPDHHIQVDNFAPKPVINWPVKPSQSGQTKQTPLLQTLTSPQHSQTGDSLIHGGEIHSPSATQQHPVRPQHPEHNSAAPQRPERFVRPPRPEHSARDVRPQRRPDTRQTQRPPTRPTRPQPPKSPVR